MRKIICVSGQQRSCSVGVHHWLILLSLSAWTINNRKTSAYPSILAKTKTITVDSTLTSVYVRSHSVRVSLISRAVLLTGLIRRDTRQTCKIVSGTVAVLRRAAIVCRSLSLFLLYASSSKTDLNTLLATRLITLSLLSHESVAGPVKCRQETLERVRKTKGCDKILTWKTAVNYNAYFRNISGDAGLLQSRIS